MRLIYIVRLASLFLSASFLSGCIRDRAYQPVGVRAPKYTSPALEAGSAFGDNVSTIELDGTGKLHDCCGTAQLVFAEKLIQSARDGVDDQSKIVVLVFIHGNQNNARLDSNNYPHFLQLMDCLNSGREEYNRHVGALADGELKRRFAKFKGDDTFQCEQPRPAPETRYVGVYIGWRGSLNILRLDFQQRAARRVADNGDILRILRTLRRATKPEACLPSRPVCEPSRLVLLGHSFGGLILERAIYRMYQSHAAGPKAVQPFADVSITANEATGGLLAKRLIEKTNGYSIATLTPGSNDLPARPLLITLHSKSDPLTGPFATAGRRIVGPPPAPKAISPDNDKAFAEPEYVQSGDKPDMTTVRRSNPSNLLYFDSGCYLGEDERDAAKESKASITGDRPGCDDVARALVKDSTQEDRLKLFHVGGNFPELGHLYRRIQYKCRGKDEEQLLYENRPVCNTADSTLENDFTLLPWNRSADWMINVPPRIIAGHGGYWQPVSIALVVELANVWPVLKSQDSLP